MSGSQDPFLLGHSHQPSLHSRVPHQFPQIKQKLRPGCHGLAISSNGNCLLTSMAFHYCASMVQDAAGPECFPSHQKLSEHPNMLREGVVQSACSCTDQHPVDALARMLLPQISEPGLQSAHTCADWCECMWQACHYTDDLFMNFAVMYMKRAVPHHLCLSKSCKPLGPF